MLPTVYRRRGGDGPWHWHIGCELFPRTPTYEEKETTLRPRGDLCEICSHLEAQDRQAGRRVAHT
jgi:hypothetical protein